ncbi:unnamed protein product [Blumeria hordei]|uniref:Glutathione peroxidase n=2 Tax=Blumeria hordei TaxID=2867405 RepID=A0A383V174_BLUHO|nr:unnamed protein product [Blumeria hordei]
MRSPTHLIAPCRYVSSPTCARTFPSISSIGSKASVALQVKIQYSTMGPTTTLYDFKPKDKNGEPVPLEKYKGQVVLIVNTASKCGFTPQFEGLEKLYKSVSSTHPGKFTILGFPCNQFGGQDPGSNDEIQNFCRINYGVTFPMLGKVNVNGDTADPLFEWLKVEKPGIMGMKRVKWNFEKWLVSKDGKPIKRYSSTAGPEGFQSLIIEEIEK